MKITAAGLLLKYLEAEGVEYIFGVPGTSLVPLFDALNKQDAIKPILTKHEEGAAFMADGCARVSGKIGVCYATSGLGATNLVSDVANAYMDNVPLLVITGQVPTSIYGKVTFQDSTKEGVDSVAMLEPVTELSTMIMSRYKMPEALRRAFRIAFSGKKGPVHLSCPKDIMEAEVEDTLLPPRAYTVEPDLISAFGMLTMGYATAAAIGGKLAAPNRPVIAVVGDGCFLMIGMEVATAVNHDIPVVWIVHNNAKLGLVNELQKFSLADRTVSPTFKGVNLAKVAEGLGAQGFRVERPGELSPISET
jgi:thiamine pyrophosphate-dependent acetolactate synthase large subunit-like protein